MVGCLAFSEIEMNTFNSIRFNSILLSSLPHEDNILNQKLYELAECHLTSANSRISDRVYYNENHFPLSNVEYFLLLFRYDLPACLCQAISIHENMLFLMSQSEPSSILCFIIAENRYRSIFI